VTNGERWMLVDAPRGETSGYASWYASLWLEEPLTLRAFRSLLGVQRFFGVADKDTLEGLLARSAANQQEVTDQLGYQVRKAVEVLIQSLERADQDHGRALLLHIKETELYEAALTVMMRLVFLFCAEERELLLLGDDLYDQHYALSTIREQLRATADQFGEEVLERRHEAWCRLLTAFRVVYGGVWHDNFKLPAYGGRLFDPDRFPFLEGRRPGTSWRDAEATPLPVNNRTVLHLLEALQVLQVKVPGGGPAEARRLSFRALDIEQIGHVYEGLLDHTARRAGEPYLGLAGAKNQEPEIALAKLEELRAKGEKDLFKFLKDETGRSEAAIKKALKTEFDAQAVSQFRSACQGDETLWHRVQPFAGLVRLDTCGYPVVIPKASVFVTEGTDRRSSGTHYTPRSLTEPIVQYTLEPLAYAGPAEGLPKDQWKLKSAKELLDLKICDMACGSGAFLVQACRYLSERLLEAWDKSEKEAQANHQNSLFEKRERTASAVRITPYGLPSAAGLYEQLVPLDLAERLTYARRIVAQRCLYGVDKNPLAVEMAKLSLWLLTLAKDKPFEFLDHAIRCGDSLVGIHHLDQLRYFNLDPSQGRSLFTGPVFNLVDEAVGLRQKIEAMPSNTVEDVEAQEKLLAQAEEKTARLRCAADLLLSVEFQGVSAADKQSLHDSMAIQAGHYVENGTIEEFRQAVRKALKGQQTFHWPLEFPEVFQKRGGFDAFVCNPPFMGGKKITGTLGDSYREYLVGRLAMGQRGHADLCAYFFLRGKQLLREGGQLGFLATNTIAQGDTREVGLEQLTTKGCVIPRAVPSRPWPGLASVEVAHIWVRRGTWGGPFVLDDQHTSGITAFLTSPGTVVGNPYRLNANAGKSFIGSYVLGMGFVLEPEEARRLIEKDARNKEILFPYMNGEDLNSRPDQSGSRWVINFFDWHIEKAMQYTDCYSIVEAKVKPFRQPLKRKQYREIWWRYAERQPALQAAIAGMTRVLVLSLVNNHLGFGVVPTGTVFAHKLAVFVSAEWGFFSVLQSHLHYHWAWHYCSTMRRDINYSPSDCFETFPFPNRAVLPAIGERYHEHRRQVMLARQEGLTKTYNRFHNSEEVCADIQKLRQLHVEMDRAVAAAYGWTDLDLGHGFHQTKQGLRYTISEPARREVLARLLKLNHERYAEEVRQGLHEKKKANRPRKPKTGANSEERGSLFSEGAASASEDGARWPSPRKEHDMATVPSHEAVNETDERTKPPFLRRVRIRGYKSIAFCDVRLQPLTILVGLNASGKSNFLDALAFLGDALRVNVSEAVNLHGGFPAILCRSVGSSALSFQVEAAFSDQAASYVAQYGVTIQANQDSPPVVSHEVLRFEDVTRNRIRQFEARQGKMGWSDDGVSPQSSTPPLLPPDHLYLGYLGEPPFPALADSLRYMGTYNFHPEAIRRLRNVGVGYLLERDGSNLASVVAMLQEKDPNLLERVKAYLGVIAPEVQEFFTVRYGEYETLRFRLRSDAESPRLEFDAASMSDGTLRALAAIMAAFQFVFPQGRNSVIGIEEPESSLHPAAMRALVDALDDATQRTQVLLTTHSADLLSGRDVSPGQVLVVRNRGGQTHITPVDPASREIIQKELYSLAELQRMDKLDLDEADLKRQAQLRRQEGV
jgi:predicted ATPase